MSTSTPPCGERPSAKDKLRAITNEMNEWTDQDWLDVFASCPEIKARLRQFFPVTTQSTWPAGMGYPLSAHVFFRKSTDEWVLEIEGSINDTHLSSRHTQPAHTAPENVASLSTLYETQALAEELAAALDGVLLHLGDKMHPGDLSGRRKMIARAKALGLGQYLSAHEDPLLERPTVDAPAQEANA
jgi:hypothetical protein